MFRKSHDLATKSCPGSPWVWDRPPWSWHCYSLLWSCQIQMSPRTQTRPCRSLWLFWHCRDPCMETAGRSQVTGLQRWEDLGQIGRWFTVWSTRWTTETTSLFAMEMMGYRGWVWKGPWYPSVQGIDTNVIRCHTDRIILEVITCCYWVSIDLLTLCHWLTPKEQKGRILIMNILHMLIMIRARQ